MATGQDEGRTLEILQEEISLLQQDATKLQEMYDSIRTCETMSHNEEKVAKCVMKRKLSLLKAEVEILKQTDVNVLPENDALWVECFLQELSKSVRELKATASDLKSEKEDLKSKIAGVQESIDRETELQRALHQKLKDLHNVPVSSKESLYKAAVTRSKKVHAHLDGLSKEMSAFFSVHFPLPSAEEIAQYNQDVPIREGLQSMSDIIQKLVGEWTLCRHSPYVSSQGFWPPYLELILRTGIAERHPRNPNLLRLQDFS